MVARGNPLLRLPDLLRQRGQRRGIGGFLLLCARRPGAQTLYRAAALCELRRLRSVACEYSNPLCELRTLRFAHLLTLQQFLRRTGFRLCLCKLLRRGFIFLGSAPRLRVRLPQFLCFIERGHRVPCTVEFSAKLLHGIYFRAHLLRFFPCLGKRAETHLRCRPLLSRAACLPGSLFHLAETRRILFRIRVEPVDAVTEFFDRCELLRLQHLLRARTILRRCALKYESFLCQRLLKPPIPLRAEDALHDRAAVFDLGEQKPLELPLRQQDDLTELIGVESDERPDAL